MGCQVNSDLNFAVDFLLVLFFLEKGQKNPTNIPRKILAEICLQKFRSDFYKALSWLCFHETTPGDFYSLSGFRRFASGTFSVLDFWYAMVLFEVVVEKCVCVCVCVCVCAGGYFQVALQISLKTSMRINPPPKVKLRSLTLNSIKFP